MQLRGSILQRAETDNIYLENKKYGFAFYAWATVVGIFAAAGFYVALYWLCATVKP